jgi:hypothetical protein
MNLINPKNLDYFTIYDSPEYDACWGMVKGKDNKIYIPICQEYVPGSAGQIYRFGIDREEFEHIVDLSKVTGDDPKSGRAPQGKAHFSLCPASDLKIYGATHATPPPARVPFQYDPYGLMNDGYRYFAGSHLFYYDSVSRDVVDFGVILPHQGCGTMLLDENVERFFGITYPLGHLFSCNLKGRDFMDLGKVSEQYLLSIVKGSNGAIYFVNSEGNLVSVNPKNFKVTFTDIFLPQPGIRNIAYMSMSDAILGPDEKVYCSLYGYTNIVRFWQEKGKIIVEDMGFPYDEEVDNNYTRPRALVFDKSGSNLYYIVVKKYESYLVSLNTEDNSIVNHGAIVKDGIKGTGWRMVNDDKGRIYFADVGQVPVNLWRFDPNK